MGKLTGLSQRDGRPLLCHRLLHSAELSQIPPRLHRCLYVAA